MNSSPHSVGNWKVPLSHKHTCRWTEENRSYRARYELSLWYRLSCCMTWATTTDTEKMAPHWHLCLTRSDARWNSLFIPSRTSLALMPFSLNRKSGLGKLFFRTQKAGRCDVWAAAVMPLPQSSLTLSYREDRLLYSSGFRSSRGFGTTEVTERWGLQRRRNCTPLGLG